ncbi:hypothetical protein [Nitratifractor sp.]
MIKQVLRIFLLLAGVTLGIEAAVRGDVKVLEASDTIRYRINELAKNYLLYYRFPYRKDLQSRVEEDLELLRRSFRDIAVTTKDVETKNILAYFAYEKARIEEILEGTPSVESARELLEMSEAFLEGVDVIARHHAYRFSLEERMFMRTRSMMQRLEEILKYYIAAEIFADDPQIRKKLRHSTELFEESLQKLNAYRYSDRIQKNEREGINAGWSVAVKYLDTPKKRSIPLVLDTGSRQMERRLETLGIFHSKNQ